MNVRTMIIYTTFTIRLTRWVIRRGFQRDRLLVISLIVHMPPT